MVFVPTVNIVKDFYTKLCSNDFQSKVREEFKSIRLCVNDFHRDVNKGVNVIITAYNHASKCLGE